MNYSALPSSSAASSVPPDPPDSRAAGLCEWVRTLYPDARLSPLAGDASFRRYFRVRLKGGGTLVAMDAPPPNENVAAFVAAREFLSGRVSVPEICAADAEKGFALLEDFGDRTYAAALEESGADSESLYADATLALTRIQAAPMPECFPRYDEALLRRETALFAEWHCRRAVGRPLSGAALSVFQRADSFLVSRIARMPVCAVHRDYHSRNLMVLEGDEGGRNPGALDFQDAVLGPATYDLASLARDAYVAPDEKRCGFVLDLYWRAAREAGLRPAKSTGELRRDFEIVSVQRGLKVLGIFCRLAMRDGKRGYLADLPVVRANALAACARVEELRELGKVLTDIAPAETTR